jgi:hypothetical protein
MRFAETQSEVLFLHLEDPETADSDSQKAYRAKERRVSL